MAWFARLRAALARSRDSLAGVEALAAARRPLDSEFWDEFEEILIAADLGVPTTEKILDGLKVAAHQELWSTSDRAIARFKRDLAGFLDLSESGLHLEAKPSVILVVGVNGSGKTTTIGKWAAFLGAQRKSVLLVAADTFRAAAADQLEIWAKRSGAEIVRGREGADPSSVVYDGVAAAKARGIDVAIVDTAGRLQTKVNLMEELKKMRRVIERELPGQPAETLLVLDGTTGQNAISQAKLFNEATALTGVVVTKLDSSAKGGVLIAVVDELAVPIKFIGLGEDIDALRPFEPAEFLDALFDVSTAHGRAGAE
ncbi:MAG: signal recognition particle-docking protein FtsY [Candidatus Eremiobacteraeota bacterium]|nr:signal recognition particle-docking protein FtsY [Candidatus Eremiobacteraeota bacterium]